MPSARARTGAYRRMAILVHRFFPIVRLRDACTRNERALLIAMNPTRDRGEADQRRWVARLSDPLAQACGPPRSTYGNRPRQTHDHSCQTRDREGAVEPRWTSTATRTSGNPVCGAGGCTIVLMSHIGERDGDLGVGDPVR